MQEVLEFIVKNLVQNKDSVQITKQEHGKHTNFIVVVDEKDLGNVIGRAGAIANSIRTVVQALNPNHGRVSIKFKSNEGQNQ